MTQTIAFTYRETPTSIETCGCYAPGCKRGAQGMRCEKPASVEVDDPYGGGWDVCADCFGSHFPTWMVS